MIKLGIAFDHAADHSETARDILVAHGLAAMTSKTQMGTDMIVAAPVDCTRVSLVEGIVEAINAQMDDHGSTLRVVRLG